jgi:hypothetical protein
LTRFAPGHEANAYAVAEAEVSNVSKLNSSPAAQTVKKTKARLADGREIIYFDESGDVDRAIPDTRELSAFQPLPTIRYDARLDECVGLSDHRQTHTYLPPDDQCPLCPSTAERATEILATSYDVVLLRVHAKCIAGQHGQATRRFEQAMRHHGGEDQQMRPG